MTPLLLGALALLLAGPVPALLGRLPVLRRTPGPALVLWQAVALAAVLAALGAGLSVVTTAAWRRDPGPVATAVAAVALAVTLLVLARLLLSAHRVGTELRRLRRRHRSRLDLLATAGPGGLRVLEHPVPVAYCVPAAGRSRVVLSAGALDRLEPDQRRAVLAHERAHLRARHDLVLEAFQALHRAFPRWASSGTARREVALLVELAADRAAARRAGPAAVAGALLAVADGRAPAGAVGAGGADLVARVELLRDPSRRPVQAALLLVAAAALLTLPTMLVVSPWLAGL